MAAEAQDRAARVQAQLRDMQRNLEQWQGQYGGLQSQDLGQVVLDAGRSGGLPLEVPPMVAGPGGGRWGRGCQPPLRSAPLSAVSSLEKTLPQLLAKLNLLENRGVHNASLALSASISRVRALIAEARGAASKVGRSTGGRGPLGEQGRMLTGCAPYAGQGVHEVQRAVRGAAACPSGPQRPRRLHRPQVLPPEPNSSV